MPDHEPRNIDHTDNNEQDAARTNLGLSDIQIARRQHIGRRIIDYLSIATGAGFIAAHRITTIAEFGIIGYPLFFLGVANLAGNLMHENQEMRY